MKRTFNCEMHDGSTPRQMTLQASVALDIVCQNGRGRNVPSVSCFLQTISTSCYGVFIHTASLCSSDNFQISVMPTKVMFSANVYVKLKCQRIIIQFLNKTEYATYCINYKLYLFKYE